MDKVAILFFIRKMLGADADEKQKDRPGFPRTGLSLVPQLHEVGHQPFGTVVDRQTFDLARDGFQSFQLFQP